MGDPRGAKAPAGIAQSIIGARKPPYHYKVMDHTGNAEEEEYAVDLQHKEINVPGLKPNIL